jgi:hypothetical protein
MTITSLRDLMTGDKFSCRIQSVAVTGTVTVGRDYIYLCQNKKNGGFVGGTTQEKHGYKYTWVIPKPAITNMSTMETLLSQQAVTLFRITKGVPRETVVKKAPAKRATKKTVSAPQTTDEEIALAEKKLADLKAKKAKERVPSTLLNWGISETRKNGKDAYQIGCGVVTVTHEEAAIIALVLHQMLTRSPFEGNFRNHAKTVLKVAAKLGNVPHLITNQ